MLAEVAKKKKSFIVTGIVVFVLLAFSFMVFNSFTKVKKERLYAERETQKITNKDVSLISENAFNESWALSMENNLEKQTTKINKFIVNTDTAIKQMSYDLNRTIVDATLSMKDSQKASEEQMRADLDEVLTSIQSQIDLQNEKFVDINNGNYSSNNFDPNLLPKPNLINDSSFKDNNSTNSITASKKEFNSSVLASTGDSDIASILGESNSNSIDKDTVKVVVINKPKKRVAMLSLDVEENEELIEEEEAELKRIQNSLKKIGRTYHVSTGIAKAFLLTGAYAPAFSSGDEGSLPILIEVNGNIIQANNEIGNLDKCFLTGSAAGDMSTQTAKIRIQAISCVLNGGKQIIEGKLSGWVVGNNGIPNIHGDLLHKNGAWMTRTFLSGFLQSASTALSGITTVQNVSGAVSDPSSIAKQSIGSAAAGGASTIFEKLGDYYLKMAEQIFPVIEIKAGQEVSIYLLGGEDLIVRDANTVSLENIEENIKKEIMLKNKESILSETMPKDSKGNIIFDKITTKKSESNIPSLPKLPTIGEK